MRGPIVVAPSPPSRPGWLVLIGRWLGLFLLLILGIAALVYVGDTALFYLSGKPQDQVNITRYMATPLKNHKTEYFYEGTGTVACSRTLFPQGGMDPCWYRKKHPLYAENL
jgi:hypothetical protein